MDYSTHKVVFLLLSSFLSILAILGEYRDKETKRITLFGKIAIALLIILACLNVAIEMHDRDVSRRSSQQLDQRTYDTVQKLRQQISGIGKPKFKINLEMDCNIQKFSDLCKSIDEQLRADTNENKCEPQGELVARDDMYLYEPGRKVGYVSPKFLRQWVRQPQVMWRDVEWTGVNINIYPNQTPEAEIGERPGGFFLLVGITEVSGPSRFILDDNQHTLNLLITFQPESLTPIEPSKIIGTVDFAFSGAVAAFLEGKLYDANIVSMDLITQNSDVLMYPMREKSVGSKKKFIYRFRSLIGEVP